MVSEAGQGDWLAELAEISDRYLRAVPTIPEPRSAVAAVAAAGEGSPPVGSEAELAPGAALLHDVETFLARFVSFPSEQARVATVLWAAHTHLLGALDSTPRLAFLSPEPGSGKTRALEVLELLCPRPLHVANTSPAALFRAVDADAAGSCTLLYDEVDTVFGPKARDNEDLRGLLNAGHRRGATVLRCEIRPTGVVPVQTQVFAAVALAGLGDLPDTLLSRSIVIRMRRRAPGERIEPFRPRLHEPAGHALREQLALFADEHAPTITGTWPVMPEGITDRDADVWEPLLAVADAAGGDWPERGRVSAVTHVTARGEGPQSLNVRLLADLWTIFAASGQEGMFTEHLLRELHALDESPWADMRGKPLDQRGLAFRLGGYGPKSKSIRVGDRIAKGYSKADLHDPWSRYLLEPHYQKYLPLLPHTRVTDSPSAEEGPPPQSVTSDTSDTDGQDELPLDPAPTDKPGAAPSPCSVCGQPLDPALAEPTHPACSPDERASR